MSEQWTTVWRLNRMTDNPEQVRVLPVSHDFVLVEGEDHTSYKGVYFPSPEAAFIAAEEDAARSIRHGQEKLERIARARARFEKKGAPA